MPAPSTPEPSKLTICQAFAREEGFGVPNGRATRNNNPGDIIWGAFAQSHGATRAEVVGPHATPRFAFFPDPPTGFSAMKILLLKHYKGLTITQTLAKYAPSSDNNNTGSYIANVCKWTGLTPDTIIDDHL